MRELTFKRKWWELNANLYREPECGSHYEVILQWGPKINLHGTPAFRYIWQFHMELRPVTISFFDRANVLSVRTKNEKLEPTYLPPLER